MTWYVRCSTFSKVGHGSRITFQGPSGARMGETDRRFKHYLAYMNEIKVNKGLHDIHMCFSFTSATTEINLLVDLAGFRWIPKTVNLTISGSPHPHSAFTVGMG